MPTIIKMTLQQVLDKLKDMGTEQNIKTYKRHGASEPLFGVSFANLGKLRSSIKKDHDLALRLWDTGNYDARNLATMIAEPEKFSREEAEHWIASAGAYGLVDLVADLISKTAFAEELMHEYMQSEPEYLKQGGYAMLSCCLKNGTEISDSQCLPGVSQNH